MRRKPPRTSAASVDVVCTVARRDLPSAASVEGWARRILGAAAGRRAAGVSILLCGDGRMRTLNRSFRKKDRPTDVLSFLVDDPVFLGDLAIDVPYAARQARARGHELSREIQILLVHGLLHLLGHDHEIDDGTMFRLQRRHLLGVFGPGPDGVP